jgi:ABC-2 type transport system permease protein
MWEITRKDLEELRGSRAILASILVLPVVLVIEGLFLVAASNAIQVPVAENLYLAFFLAVPAIISVMIASSGVVQEKTNHTLEPLLATPITDGELLWGKALAPLLPAVGVTIGAYLAYFVGVDVLLYNQATAVLLPNALALYLVFAMTPLLAFLGTFTALFVSARMPDVRSAQQFSMMVVAPGFLVAILLVVFVGTNWAVLGGIGLVLLVAVWLVSRRVVERFERGSILVAWH